MVGSFAGKFNASRNVEYAWKGEKNSFSRFLKSFSNVLFRFRGSGKMFLMIKLGSGLIGRDCKLYEVIFRIYERLDVLDVFIVVNARTLGVDEASEKAGGYCGIRAR